jgi:hypothetical protein
MAERSKQESTGRTIAIVGGAALLALLLLRGKGWGLGRDRGAASGPGDARGDEPQRAPRAPCKVRIDDRRIELDGAPADLATVTERCRVAGSADVHATGLAIVGVIGQVIQALRDAGVAVYAEPELWNSVPHAYPRRTS